MAGALSTSTTTTATRPPRRLSAAELEAYRRDGFVLVPEIFSADELDRVDREIDRLLPEYEDREVHRRGWILDLQSALTTRVADDERVLSLIQDIVGPGIAIHSMKLVAKLPHSQDICHWHQDEAFYQDPDDPSTRSTTRMSVWIPLQNSDERNGCLWAVPGSHRWGVEPFVPVDYGQCRRRLTKHQFADERAVPLPVAAGSAVLFSAWSWHHSKNNATARIRRAFIISYQEATAAPGTGPYRDQWRLLRKAPPADA